MKTLFLFFFSLFALNIVLLPQQLGKADFNKLDPRLNLYLNARQANPKTVTLPKIMSEETDQNLIGVIIKTDNPAEIINNGISYNSMYNGFVTARVTLEDIVKLSNLSSIKSIQIGEEFYPQNDVAGGVIGSKLLNAGVVNGTQYNGTNVIVLVIDTGIDWSHLDFRNTSDPTQSRILYIWDQTITKTGSEKTPQDRDGVNYSGLNYGVEYSQSDINGELGVSPPGFVRETDSNGHGSHVTGSAAGNGSSLATKKYAGIAPNADIVFVKAGNGSFSNSNCIDALTYAKKISAQFSKPVVVNMSLGGQSGAHDGTSTFDAAVDQFTASGNGRIAVISAGNDGANNIHITGTIANSATANITFTVPTYTPNSGTSNDYFGFDFWSSTNGSLSATVTSPNSLTATQNAQSQGTTQTNDGTIYIYNYVDSNNNNREVYLYINDANASYPPAQGTWTLAVTNNSGSSVTYHGWVFANSMSTTLNSGNSQYTVGSPGTASSAITAGSFVTRWRWYSSGGGAYSYSGTDGSDNISSFSSIGPRRDGAQKPDIAAPGQAIISVKSSASSPASSNIVPGGFHLVEQGTSMASPITAGTVALLLQQNSNLTYSQVKSYLTSNADADSYVGAAPNNTWGYGKLNAFKAMVNLVNSGWQKDYSILAYDQWVSSSGYSIATNEKFAVKFTPSFNGQVAGAFIHLYTLHAITGSLYFEIWSDNSGLPGSKLGSTVALDQTNLESYSWNYVDMTGAGVNVTSGTNYHIVAYFTSGSSTTFSIDNGTSDSRSSYNTGGGWTSYANDFRIRTLIVPSASALPVELVNFGANAMDNKVTLNWKTATEVNNYGFDVERRMQNENGSSASLSASWLKIAFVKGSGNSNSPKNYSFTDVNLPSGKILYRLKQIDLSGSFVYSPEIEANIAAPDKFSLTQNFPNPFNPETVISFQLPSEGLVTLKVYDVLGKEVATLVNEKKLAGKYDVKFDGSKLASGVYFYRLSANNFNAIKKFVLMK